MIIDSLKNAERYEYLNPLFKKAFDYVKTLDIASFVAGKIELDGKNLFVNANATVLKKKEDAPLETHIEYIDIQIPLDVAESYGWKDIEKCTSISSPYDSEKDLAFYSDKPTTYFTLQPGEFVIFFPEDAHAPCVGEGEIKKLIIKVKI